MDETEVMVKFPEMIRAAADLPDMLSEMRLSVRRLSGSVVVFIAADVLPPVVADVVTPALEMPKK
jgi:hypothetical protein